MDLIKNLYEDGGPLTQEEMRLIVRVRHCARFQRLIAGRASHPVVAKSNRLVADTLRAMLGDNWTDSAIVNYQRDIADAAGECRVSLPQPGSDLAKVLAANNLLRKRLSDLRDNVNFHFTPSDDDDREINEHAKAEGLTVQATVHERLGDDIFCERVRRFILNFPNGGDNV